MGFVARKSVVGVPDMVSLKLACWATKSSKNFEMLRRMS